MGAASDGGARSPLSLGPNRSRHHPATVDEPFPALPDAITARREQHAWIAVERSFSNPALRTRTRSRGQLALLEPRRGPRISAGITEKRFVTALKPTFAADFGAAADSADIWRAAARQDGRTIAHRLTRCIADARSMPNACSPH